MMSDLISKWKAARRSRKDAEYWDALPEGKKYENNKFNISIAHCAAPVLCRAGQQSCG
ncbi:MAG: hypothetical protein GY928_20315, partial [Colwellia sp.]|nr:hypothetical protein [Colwellia sp.]